MKLESILLHFKGHEGVYDLPALAAFVGPPRAGKTAIREAIVFALTGQHPVGATQAALAELLGEASYLIIRLETDEGHAVISADRKGDSISKPSFNYTGGLQDLGEEGRRRLLPSVAWTDIVNLKSDKARAAVFARFGEAASVTPVGLSTAQKDKWADEVYGQDDLAGALTAAEAKWRGEKVSLGRKIGAMNRELEAARASIEDGGSEQLESLRAQLVEAKARASMSNLTSLRASLTGQVAQLEADLKTAKRRLREEEARDEAASALRDEITTQRAELKRKAEQLAGKIAAGRELLKFADKGTHNGTCPLCGTDVADIRAHVAGIRGRTKKREAEHARIEKQLARAEVVCAPDLSPAKTEIGRLVHELAVAKYNLSQLGDVDGVPTPPPSALSLPELEEAIARAEEAQMATRRIDSLTSDIRKLEQQQKDVSGLEKEAKRLIGKLLVDTKARAEAAVKARSLPGWKAELDIVNSRWLLIGSDGRGHPAAALSGAEQALLGLSLMLAWCEEPPIVLLDDRDFVGLTSDLAREFLSMLAARQEAGDIAQVLVFRNRPEDIPGEYEMISIGE